MIKIRLCGKIRNSGPMIIPQGITWQQLIWEYGGGIPGKREFKMARLGDVFYTAADLPEPVPPVDDGEIETFDENSCPLALSFGWLDEEGVHQPLTALLVKIRSGKGNESDLASLEDMLRCAPKDSFALRRVTDLWNKFEQEFRLHVTAKLCPGGVCAGLTRYYISDGCHGCMMCSLNCPAGAISGEPLHQYIIDQEKCIGCGKCLRSCKFRAVKKRRS